MFRFNRFSSAHFLAKRRGAVLAVLVGYLAIEGCALDSPREKEDLPAASSGPAQRLAGTRWRLVEIQSMDDAIGTARPSDRDLYTLDLNRDGTAAMRLDCNRGRAGFNRFMEIGQCRALRCSSRNRPTSGHLLSTRGSQT